MKLGSANKWIELLFALPMSSCLNDGYGLHWADGSFSPVGILEDFITREWKPYSHSGCFANKEGKLFVASQECLDKCKCKTNIEVIDDLWPKVNSIPMLCFLIGYNQETL